MTRARLLRRPGITLVEILVTVAIIILIAGLVAVIANSGVTGSWEVTGSVDRVSGWLLISKQRAARDGAPRGIRIMLKQPDPVNDPLFLIGTDVQYIEMPEPWIPNPWQETEPTVPITDPSHAATTGWAARRADRLRLSEGCGPGHAHRPDRYGPE